MSLLTDLAGSLTLKRTGNLLMNEAGYYLSVMLRRPVVLGLPWSVSIEPTTSCNLKCPECPTGTGSLQRATGSMDFELYEKLIRELDPHLIYLTLYFQGEPYLNRHFFEMVRMARRRNIFVATSTNAHFLNDENARLTVESGLNRIIISMDGADQATYEKYRRQGNLEKVTQGIANLVSWKKKLGSNRPFIELQFLVLGTNEHQLDEIREFAGQSGVDRLTLKTAQVNDFSHGSPFIPKTEKYARYMKTPDEIYRVKKRLRNSCHRLWRSTVITWDWQVLPCCFDKDAHFGFGTIAGSTFRETWKNGAAAVFRKKIMENRHSIPVCCNCTE